MKLTKYQHACFTVELDGQLVLIDPGNLTADLDKIANLAAVVITHQHPDHYDPGLLSKVASEAVPVYAHQSVLDSFALPTGQSVEPGEVIETGPFRLEFYGGDHATIHPAIPGIANLGVSINQTIYYPGDSFAVPDEPVEVLLLPVAAPWMKIAESIDYANTIQPRIAIPTHDAILSPSGQAIVDRVVSSNLVPGIDYRRVDEGLVC